MSDYYVAPTEQLVQALARIKELEDKLMSEAVILTSDVFGKVLFTKNGVRDDYPVWDVYLSDSTGQFYYNDSTVLEPPSYIKQQEDIVYDDLANIETDYERFEHDFEQIFGTY